MRKVKVNWYAIKPIHKDINCLLTIQIDHKYVQKKQNLQTFHYFLCQIKKPEKENTKNSTDIKNKNRIISSMSTYVPNMVLDRILNDPKADLVPSKAVFNSSILFIDVSGFTALNERLAQLGTRGPEQVSKHLNKYFGQLIQVVLKHGGDVLKFAGDALICVFGNPNLTEQKSVKELAIRAIQCGIEIQTEHSEYDSNEGFKLSNFFTFQK